jgi:dipeptidyl-peptidase-4
MNSKKYTLKKLILLSLALSTFCGTYSQPKKIDSDYLIKGQLPVGILESTPAVNKWLGNHKAEVFMKEGNTMKNLILDLKTGFTEDNKNIYSSATATESKKILLRNGDLFFIEKGNETQLTFDPKSPERNPTFSPDSVYVAYTKNNNLYTINLSTKRETQLTIDGNKTILNGYATWLYWEEIFGRGTLFRAFWWSHDSKKLAFMRFDESKVPMFPIYNSDGQHGYIEETRYPKVGDANPTVKIGFTDPDGNENMTWADFENTDNQYFGWPKWTFDNKALIVQWINRGNDHLKIFSVDHTNGKKIEIYEEKQKTWINIDEADERLSLLENGKEMLIISDKTGYKHLYLYSLDGKLKNEITSGNFTVLSVKHFDQKNKWIFFTARGKENSARTDFYKVSLDGKTLKKLSSGNYHLRSITPSPDFQYFTLMYSNINSPTEVAIIDQNGKIIKNLGNAKGPNFEEYDKNIPELIRVKSDDGLFELPMTVVYPENIQPDKKYPVLINIYGGPNAGTVWDTWSWNARTQWYAREGLIQVSMDHRGSGHFGKKGQEYLYRNLGDYELRDYSTMVKYLIEKGFADPNKIAITGFSYGGYMSCLALTKYADVFTHGMAGGSVTDWKLYDSAYTERFMDTPEENPDGYKSSNVMNFTSNYKGKLQIVHGTLDDNVHLQHSIQLIDKLQEEKKDFEMMFYPGGRHGWGGAKKDHFENEKIKFIYKYLLEREIPDGLLR